MSQQPFGIRFGNIKTTSVSCVVCSLVSGSVTVTVDGADTVIALADPGNAIGTDNTPAQDQAGFVNNATITGLSPFTRYTYTATQGSNTVSGQFYTAPTESDDFAVYFASCDAIPNQGGDQNGNGYAQMRSYVNSGGLPVVGIIHVDDYGYWDWHSFDDSAGTGHSISGALATSNALVYDFALGALNQYGLFSDTSQTDILFGQDDDRVWATRNLSLFPQWGDHDCGVNEMGWGVDPTDATGSPSPADKFNNSTSVWTEFLGPLQGDSIGTLDTSANHWALDLGSLYVVCPDGITNGSGDGLTANPFTPPTTVYGTNQVDDCLNALNAQASPFNVIGMDYSIRRLSSDTSNQQGAGAQNAISGHADYARLFTASGGSSVMSNPKLNGRYGTTFTLHGDNHRCVVTKNANTSGVLDEWFYSICAGTINGSANFENDTSIPVGTTYDGSTVEAIDPDTIPITGNGFWVCRLDVYGSKYPKELHIHITDKDGTDIWSGKFVHQITIQDAVSLITKTFDKRSNYIDLFSDGNILS